MKGRSKADRKRLTAALLVLVMSLLMVNRALYTHIHVLPNGSAVSHAHPFSKGSEESNGKDHQHSGLEFFLLDQLDVLTFATCALLMLRALSFAVVMRERPQYRPSPSLIFISPGRAPPACM